MHSSVTERRKRSPVTQPGYGLGRKPANAGKTYPAEVYSRREVDGLMRELSRGYLGHRNRAIVVTMWRQGLRIEEALALNAHDVDIHERTLFVRHGKNNRQRLLGVDNESAGILEEWLDTRSKLEFGRHDPLFPVCYGETRGKRIYSSDFRDAMKLAGHRALAGRRWHPHGLRHTFASENVREGVPLPILAAMMGHEDVAYTFAYIRKVAPWEAITRMQDRTWLPATHRWAPSPAGVW